MSGYIGSKASVTLVDGYTQAEADAEFVAKAGDTMTGGLTVGGSFTSLGIDDNATSTAVTIDSAGRVTTPYQPAFDVAYSGSGYGLKNPVIFNVAYLNVGGHYSTSTGRFTAPVSGSYIFYTAFIKNNFSGTARRRFEKNATDPLGGRHLRLDSGQNFGDNGTMQATIYLNAGDYVTVAHTEGSSYGSTQYDYFGGYLIG